MNNRNLLRDHQPGLYQQKFFGWIVSQEIQKVDRTNQPFSMLLIKISAFETMAGNRAGLSSHTIIDTILNLINACLRKTDLRGWYDHDHLGILMLNTSATGALIVCRKVKEAVIGSLNGFGISPDLPFDQICRVYTYPDSLLAGNDFFEKRAQSDGQQAFMCYQNQVKDSGKSVFGRFVKRSVDLLGSVIGFLFFFPLMLIIGILVKLTSSGPVFFKQLRLGFGGKPFYLYKYRSMYHNAENKSHREYVTNLIRGNLEKINYGSDQEPLLKMHNDPRVTPFGKFLRKSSLDELPQFYNVLKGDMSLVGPRPPIPYEVEEYSYWHLKRVLAVKPGITGLWQVKGRSSTTFDDMVRLDLHYAENWSIGLDLMILFKTIKVILSAKGAY